MTIKVGSFARAAQWELPAVSITGTTLLSPCVVVLHIRCYDFATSTERSFVA